MLVPREVGRGRQPESRPVASEYLYCAAYDSAIDVARSAYLPVSFRAPRLPPGAVPPDSDDDQGASDVPDTSLNGYFDALVILQVRLGEATDVGSNHQLTVALCRLSTAALTSRRLLQPRSGARLSPRCRKQEVSCQAALTSACGQRPWSSRPLRPHLRLCATRGRSLQSGPRNGCGVC